MSELRGLTIEYSRPNELML